MEVAGQRRVLIGNLHRKNRRVVETAAEFIGGDRLLVGAIDARVFVVAMQEEFGGAEVICCAQVAVACAYAMTGSPLRFSFREDSFGRGIPFVVPAVVIARSYAIGSGHDFTELAGAVAAGAEDAFGLKPELCVVGKKRGFRCCGGSGLSFVRSL